MDDDGEGLNPQQEAAKRKALADKHQEDLINHMDAVTKRLHSNKKRGRKLFQRGLDTLEKSSKFAEFLKFEEVFLRVRADLDDSPSAHMCLYLSINRWF